MAWSVTDDLEKFRAAAWGFLASRPAVHTVPLSVAETLRLRGTAAYGEEAPLFGWWQAPGGAVRAAFVQTPPRPPATRAPHEAVAPLAEVLADRGHPLPGIIADPRAAETFAAAWRRRTGAESRVRQRQRLYRLGSLTPPRPAPPGRARVAGVGDGQLLAAWYEAFSREAGEAPADVAGWVADRLDYGGVVLWEVDGAPVSMAGRTRTVAGMARVAPVYTPLELRRRGYAGAATAAVSRAAREAGAARVVLFTDLANPTSNALYQRLGYRPVEDCVMVSFTP